VQDHQVDIHAKDEYAFMWACAREHIQIINWFIEENIHSESPYYYYNHTAYILNHEPLNDWYSCTILDYPVIYNTMLDKDAVFAFMASIRKPKSARS
jgi:hypothetical protein